MGNIFNYDSPMMDFLRKAADLMILNILTILCCIPIVTIGASFTAMHYVLLKMHRDEGTSIIKLYFHSFIKNLKQATILWGIYLFLMILVLLECYWIFIVKIPQFQIMKYVVGIFLFLLMVGMTWGFVLLSRYENSILKTFYHSFFVGLTNPGSTIVMLIFMVLPWLLPLLYLPFIIIVLLIGYSLSGYMRTMLYSKIFCKLEAQNELSETDSKEEE